MSIHASNALEVRLPDDTYRELQRRASAREAGVEELVHAAVDHWLEQRLREDALEAITVCARRYGEPEECLDVELEEFAIAEVVGEP